MGTRSSQRLPWWPNSVPRLGSDAVLVSLDLIQRAQILPTQITTTNQVWLNRFAPSDVISRLNRAGLHVKSYTTASSVEGQLDKSGPALADDFLLVTAAAALLLAVVSTLAFLAAGTRQRSNEMATLEVVGVRRGSAAWSLFGETAALAVATLFGIPAGIVAITLVVSSLPELASVPAVSPVFQYLVPDVVLIEVAVAVVISVMVASTAVNLSALRRSRDQLRGGGLR